MTRENTEIAKHDNPVRREEADFLIFADLAEHGMPGRWEQLWAKRLGETEFQLCCVPFFTYGLALDDRVTTAPSRGREHVVTSIVGRSDHLVYRVWFGDAEDRGDARASVVQGLRRENWLFEWSSENLLAVDVPTERKAEKFVSFLAGYSGRGITWEAGV